jgi:hypothetical protein
MSDAGGVLVVVDPPPVTGIVVTVAGGVVHAPKRPTWVIRPGLTVTSRDDAGGELIRYGPGGRASVNRSDRLVPAATEMLPTSVWPDRAPICTKGLGRDVMPDPAQAGAWPDTSPLGDVPMKPGTNAETASPAQSRRGPPNTRRSDGVTSTA